MKKWIWSLLAILTLTTGCSDDEGSGSLTVATSSFNWDSDVRSAQLSIKADGSWEIKSDVNWCAPIKSNGKNNATIDIWVSPNLTNQERSGHLTIETQSQHHVIDIRQPAFTGDIDSYEYHLPVVFHIMYDDASNDTLNVKQEHLAKVLTEVNKLYAENQMNIVFELAKYNDNGDELEELGISRHEVDFSEYDASLFLNSKNKDNRQYAKFTQNLKKYINVFVFRFKQDDASNVTMGISTTAVVPTAHPLDSLLATDVANDYAYINSPWGVCINNKFIYEWQDERTVNPRFIVATLAHELGHYLGLLHTFSNDECNVDDACDDTNISDYDSYTASIIDLINQLSTQGKKPTMRQVALRVDCKLNVDFLAHNVMDYAYTYADEFTAQQRKRTRHVLYYGPLIPGPKLVDYNTTGIVSRGESTSPDPCTLPLSPVHQPAPCPPLRITQTMER